MKLVAFACLVMSAASVALPQGSRTNPVESAQQKQQQQLDLGNNYTVLYDGPSGRHVQSGEPGRAVKGFYTFFDSRGKKQKVTYEADARGYRVKSTVFVDESEDAVPGNTAAARRPQVLSKTELDVEPEVRLKSETKSVHQTTESLFESATSPVAATVTPVNKRIEQTKNKNLVSSGQIKFKEPRSIRFELDQILGYPFAPQVYIYAL